MARNIRVNQSHFAMIPQANIRRSVFDRSHVYKTTFNEGQLIPYFVDEVIPGDTFTLNPVEFCRLATPVVPFMDNIYIESFFFFVPSRLVYDKWVNLCGEQENPEDSTDYLVPTVSLTGDMTNTRRQAIIRIGSRLSHWFKNSIRFTFRHLNRFL